jgi:hypothetical protein
MGGFEKAEAPAGDSGEALSVHVIVALRVGGWRIGRARGVADRARKASYLSREVSRFDITPFLRSARAHIARSHPLRENRGYTSAQAASNIGSQMAVNLVSAPAKAQVLDHPVAKSAHGNLRLSGVLGWTPETEGLRYPDAMSDLSANWPGVRRRGSLRSATSGTSANRSTSERVEHDTYASRGCRAAAFVQPNSYDLPHRPSHHLLRNHIGTIHPSRPATKCMVTSGYNFAVRESRLCSSCVRCR